MCDVQCTADTSQSQKSESQWLQCDLSGELTRNRIVYVRYSILMSSLGCYTRRIFTHPATHRAPPPSQSIHYRTGPQPPSTATPSSRQVLTEPRNLLPHNALEPKDIFRNQFSASQNLHKKRQCSWPAVF
jgi:hypothetical protein